MLSTWKQTTTAASFAAILGIVCLSATGQEPNPTTVAPGARTGQVTAQGPDGTYVYRIKVVEHDLDAVNYFHRSGSTHINFTGTNLLPGAKGEAKVVSERGGLHISAEFKGLTPANGFGPEYMTYVLWAISADGRPQNLGEVLPAGTKNNIEVTTSLQSFGLIVTAEPYFSVSMPSDVIVLQNVFSDKTQGVLEHVNVHYSLLPRGLYADTGGSKSELNPITRNEHSPLELYEAHNAARIARMNHADKYAPDIMQDVATDLQNADTMDSSKHRDQKMEITYAREAVQKAEDARISSLRKQASERQQQERADKEQAQADAAQSQIAAANANAQAEAAAAAKARAEADAANARAQAAESQHNAQKSEADASAVREKLRAQLNSVLATSESARGLIVNMSDVLFDTAKFTLKPDTKVSLAKVATILQLYPGLKVQVEGYTDSVGGDEYNQKLSENRANAVHDFLVQNGVPAANVTAAGYGKNKPVADNGTAAGRAQNRRVNLVVSGDAIGVQTTNPE
ncbi:OmpA family protein [Granulicella mallensis]|uniref:OmpA/MotB domain protein n=1 Tax=Granulicella mallensis (strain ATCC BAA-1857 / DSM 23137 / MP5ACTX8) TaxID=682795 RepID=G8NSS6_GRAMM|nr:OmpA family protein [Granulicella mallensis]AEU35175.1 OmpA/MotB domain protein [Granulicella mallensis MP5ACTX8]